MPVSRNAAIHAALKAALVSFCEDNGHALAFQGFDFPLDGGEKPSPYLAEQFLPNASTTRTAGGEPQLKRGIYQVSVYTRARQGLTMAQEIADAVVDLFAGATLYCGAVQVRIAKEPYWSSPFTDGAWTQVPVTIEYQCAN